MQKVEGTIKISAEINEKQIYIRKISKAKGWFFKKTDKIDKPNETNQKSL